jgi:predicted component of type VI protein secretion system
MFEPATPMLGVMLRQAIFDVVNNFEPRVQLTQVDVSVSDENNAIYITIEFKIVNTERPLTLDLTLERTR